MSNESRMDLATVDELDGVCCEGCTALLGSLLVLSPGTPRCPTCGEARLVDARETWGAIAGEQRTMVEAALGPGRPE